MPYKRLDEHDVDMFYVLNPDPVRFANASHDNLPPSMSNPLKPGLPVLVFVHAAASSVACWNKQLSDPRFANHFNLFAMDCRFNGLTRGGERKQHTLEDSANCVTALLDEMDFPAYGVYGEGVHGAVIAAWIAIKRPQKMTGLLLASPGWREEAPQVRAGLAGVQKALLINKKGHGGDDTGTFTREGNADICAYFIGDMPRMAPQREEMAVRFEQRYGAGHSAHDSRWLFEAVYQRKPIAQELMDTVRCPVLILRGADDNMVSPEAACEEWQRSFTRAPGGVSIHAVASAPPLISLSDPGIANRIILQFFQRSFESK
ncbi:hypothetical protein JCM21900_005260 [Sporobolomyces salmonicolor]